MIGEHTQDGDSERILVPKWVWKDSQMNAPKMFARYLLPSILLSLLAGNAVAQGLRPGPQPLALESAPVANASAQVADANQELRLTD